MTEGDSGVRLEPDEAELELTGRELEQVRNLLMRELEEAPPEAPPAPAPEPAAVPTLEEIEPRGIIRFPPILFAVPITAIERTQATQYLKINGKGSGYAADNTVPLVAGKDLILRVYVRSDSIWWPHTPSAVTGKVSYAGHPDLAPLNGPIAAMPRSALDRNLVNHTLNFRVPGAHCNGTVTFTLTIWDPAYPGDAASAFLSRSIALSFESVPRVRIHGVLIHYTGKGMNIAAPTGLDLVNTLVWVGRTYPIRGFNYTACEVVDFNGDLTVGGGGGCGTGWNQLFNMLWNMRAASGTADVFVGLLPPGVPTSGVIGCGGGGVAIAYKGGGSVLAQEIGHAFGRAHAPCGNPGGPDPNYPTYDSYPSGSIGEFGFDSASGQIFDPAGTFDFMSYCGPVWTSPYTYIGLKNGIAASPASAHPERAGGRDVEREYLYLNYRLQRGGQVDLLPSFHLYGQPPAEIEGAGRPTDVGCDLLGPNGEVLESHSCSIINPHMDPDGPVVEFHEVIPWSDEVRSIAFRRGAEVCHTVKVDERAPELTLQPVKLVEREHGLARLEWAAKKKGAAAKTSEKYAYVVRYSHDGGTTWRALAADLTESKLVVNLELLPGGDECLFQVVASSGVRTATATTEPIEIPRKPRIAAILAPADGASFAEGEAVEMLGGGFSPDFETVDSEDVLWMSSRDGQLGVGYQVVTNQLTRGRHRLMLSIPDGGGGEARANIEVTIR
jgi:hypothetical protein